MGSDENSCNPELMDFMLLRSAWMLLKVAAVQSSGAFMPDLSRKLEVNYVKFQFRGGLLKDLSRAGPTVFNFIDGIEYVLWVFGLHIMRLIASLQLHGGSDLLILLVCITSASNGKISEKNYSSVRRYVADLFDDPTNG
ncbi:hypothetical protein Tco_0044679 [Tanacetum coccineum]